MKSIWTLILCETLCLFGFIAVRANPGEGTDEMSCYPGWKKVHRGCYMFVVDVEMEWEDAMKHCKDNGGNLTTIQSWNEKEELKNYIISTEPDTKMWWVGLKRETASSNWKWLDDHPLDSNVLPWTDANQVKKSGLCGTIDLTSSKVTVSVSRCSTELPFICEYHSIIPRSTAPNTTLTSEAVFAVTTTSTSDTTESTRVQELTETTSKKVIGENTRVSDLWRSSTVSDTTGRSASDFSPSHIVTSSEDVTTVVISTTELPTTAAITSGQTMNAEHLTSERKKTTSDLSYTTLMSTAENNDVTTPGSRISDDVTTSERSSTADSTASPTTGTTEFEPDTTSSQTTTVQPVTTPTSSQTTTVRPVTTPTSSQTTTVRPVTTPTSSQTTTVQPVTTPTSSQTKRTHPATTQSATLYTTQPTTTSPDTPRPTMVDWVKAIEDFHGCYIPGTGESLRDTVIAARSFYKESRTSCPEVQLGSILWPVTQLGKTATEHCKKGDGFATFQCGAERKCWLGQPDITGCVSKKLRNLLGRMDVTDPEVIATPPSVKESIELTSQLVEVTETEETTMEDVIVMSQVMTALTHQTNDSLVMDRKQVETIVDNVVKAGSNLVSANKSAMWEDMSQDDKVRSASTLLVAMETATVSMAAAIDEPTVITQKDKNIELELHVVDMKTMDKEGKKELVYGSSESESTFSIPLETLRSASKGGLAKAVFMTHYSMSDILGGRSKKRRTRPSAKPKKYDPSVSREKENKNVSEVEMDLDTEAHEKEEEPEETGPRIASYILSASLGIEGSLTKLAQPISFTMKHLEEVDAKYTPLCSFWNVSQDMHLGFWSQEGCHLVSTNKSHTTCECDHMTNFAILLGVHGFEASKVHQSLLRLVTIIGCVISCVSLLASWFTFQCFASLQGERNSIHKNLAFTLLVAEILFVFGVDQARHQILCSVIAGFLHFFFLAAFTWMFIEGLHIIFMLVQVFDASRSRLPYYYLTGYGVPFVVVGASCLFYYRGYGTDKFCWLTTDRYFIWAFAGPVAMILLINALFLTYAMSTVCRHSDYVFSAKEKTTISGIRSWVQGALALEVLLGLTWTFGYFIINDDSLPLAYVFAILNSLQGLFVFVFHCLLNKKAQKEYRQVARTVVRRSPSSAMTHSTLTKRTHNTNHSHDVNHSPSNSHQKLNATNNHSMA